MVMRLWKKAVKMSTREKRMFIVFTLMYTVLIFWTSYSLELALQTAIETQSLGSTSFLIALGASIFLTLLYAWIIVARNRRTWATLKCIGYTNANINSLVTGIILFTTFTGFIIVLEVLFHYTAIIGYLISAEIITTMPLVLVGLTPVIFTSFFFLIVQILAIILANRKILRVRPMVALKKPGE